MTVVGGVWQSEETVCNSFNKSHVPLLCAAYLYIAVCAHGGVHVIQDKEDERNTGTACSTRTGNNAVLTLKSVRAHLTPGS